MEIQLDFMLGVVVGIIGLAFALAIYIGIAESIERNKEEKEWIRAQYGVLMTPEFLDQDHWTYNKEEAQRTTDKTE